MKQRIKVNDGTDNEKDNAIKLGTHNGLFHCDEVIACALFIIFVQNLFKDEKNIDIIRTRNTGILKKCDLCVDIDGGKYDHHYSEFNEKRDDGKGAKYASAGLMFKHFGRELIATIKGNISAEDFPQKSIASLFREIDEEIIKPIDMQDNGEQNSAHYFDFIPLFNPSWHEEQNLENFDKHFEQVLGLTIETLKSYLDRKISNKEPLKSADISNINDIDFRAIITDYLPIISNNMPIISNNMKAMLKGDISFSDIIADNCATPELVDYVSSKLEPFIHEHDFSFYPEKIKDLIIKQKIHKIVDDFYGTKTMKKIIETSQISKHSVLMIPSQTINWQEAICEFNEKNPKLGIDFVIFPYPAGGYALQCVPPSIDNEFGQRIKLLKKDKLPDGITKLHPGLFFATGDYDSLMSLANEAIQNEVNKNSQDVEH